MASATATKLEAPQEVPIFLRKTYHMIDSCDASIAAWDDDGTTFTVKDPLRFEQKIIPQFFKHSKFSSFVRQLNFYSFRKIKYSDSIRIDVETEKKTANYWRFRHEHFRQGRPDLLTEIKRMNGKGSTTKQTQPTANTTAAATSLNAPPQPAPVQSNSKVQVAEKSEVLSLKKRIEEMTKNMDALTEMVQKVSLKQDQQLPVPVQSQENHLPVQPGMKRKKFDCVETQAMDILMAHEDPQPDGAFSDMDLEDLAAMPLPVPVSSMDMPMISPMPMPLSRESSAVSDTEFVDQLFSAFNEDDAFLADTLLSEAEDKQDESSSSNRADPELMKRLGSALELLPREIQEMIINRLITAITSTEGLDASTTAVAPALTVDPKKLAVASKAFPVAAEEAQLPLAAATLAALLHHYSNQVKEASPTKKLTKGLPVIPVHG